MTTLPQLNKEFSISFKFRARAWQSGWQSVLHLTEGLRGDNCCKVGDRVPGFWVKDSGKVHACFAVGTIKYTTVSKGNVCVTTTKEYSLNTWHTVEFSQATVNGKHMYRVVIDGEEVVGPLENTKPKTFYNVQVYAADRWHNALKGSIKDLLINTDSSETCEGNSEPDVVDDPISPPNPGCSCSADTVETHEGTEGRCLTQYKGKYFCYVNSGEASTCADKQESIRTGKWWSYQACQGYDAPPISG